MNDKTKFIFLTGGVSSSSGKGITSATIGTLLESFGFKVSFRKADGYLNVNAGTMNPEQHGEVYVLDDGSETDLDLGHYSRFTNAELDRNSSITMGSVYREVTENDIRGDYDGKCVQVIPHVTDVVKKRIQEGHVDGVDFIIVEVGGTVGDMENMPLIESIRQLGAQFNREEKRVCFCHLALIPYIKAAEEWKTKPVQQSCQKLMSMGISPDLLLCRIENHVPQQIRESMREKLSLYCNVKKDNVIYMDDVKSVYEIPVHHWNDIPNSIFKHFGITPPVDRETKWIDKVGRINIKVGDKRRVGIFGKYTNVRDSYKSIAESIKHASITLGIDTEIEYYNESKEIDCNGILIPGGYGYRGVEEKENAFLYAYYQSIPCLGLCLGLQTSVVAFAREVCGIKDASYEEFAEQRPGQFIVHYMEYQKRVTTRSGTQRLGSYRANMIDKESVFFKSYMKYGDGVNQIHVDEDGNPFINERHRHRYEINSKYIDILSENGLKVVAKNEEGLVEAMELMSNIDDHKQWFIGTQFHPEYKSKFLQPHPLFISFLNMVGKS